MSGKAAKSSAAPAKVGKKAMGVGTGPAGGYVVPKGNTIVKKPKKKS